MQTAPLENFLVAVPILWNVPLNTVVEQVKVTPTNKHRHQQTSTGNTYDTDGGSAFCVNCATGKINTDGGACEYDFTSHVFNNCGKTGKDGPDEENNCEITYSYVAWELDNEVFDVQSGVQIFTVQSTATYYIYAYGAAEGDTSNSNEDGGKGAVCYWVDFSNKGINYL